MKVLKFGGTSVGKDGALAKVVDIVLDSAKEGHVAIVASALCGVTDSLIKLANSAKVRNSDMTTYYTLVQRHFTLCMQLAGSDEQLSASVTALLEELKHTLEGVKILKELSPRTLDLIMSYGEKLSCTILAAVLRARGLDAEFCDAQKFMFTDDVFGNATVDYEATTPAVRQWFNNNKKVQVVTGFSGCTSSGETTTLGRGGGDLTASVLGAILNAECIEVWTDVDGVLTANPKVVDGTFVINTLSYEEAMELSYFGAKVIYAPTMAPAMRSSVPIRIRNTFNPPAPGTMIRKEPGDNKFQIRAISSIDDITLVVLQGSDMVGIPGVAGRLFSVLSGCVNVILISQASSEHSICLAVAPQDGEKARTLINREFEREMEKGFIDEVTLHTNLSIVAIVGSQMKRVPGVAGLVTTMMGEHGCNIIALAQGSSELNMSMVLLKEDLHSAIQHIHDAFFATGVSRNIREPVRSFHIYISSNRTGEWLRYIASKVKETFKDKNLNIKILGACDAKKMRLVECHQSPSRVSDQVVRATSIQSLDIDEDSWEELAEELDMNRFIDSLKYHREFVKGRVVTVFLDDRNSEENAACYPDLLQNGAVVVTSNTCVWGRKELQDMLLHKRFMWSPASGFTLSTCTAILSYRSSDADELQIKLESHNSALLQPLHALAACPCGSPSSDGCKVSFQESSSDAAYCLSITTADEETSISCKMNKDLPSTVPQIFRKLLSIPSGI
eukprot:TRINITY_DN12009_c0_g1_i1.p1 TRINITY_DN12009_c0_g1~~TRINITY_DN12009_c0_g1_i1.p1  ORF type:complete len:730 (+),score=127.68 TRINITY_DN12009_c0_g1_i1:36-2225(+)